MLCSPLAAFSCSRKKGAVFMTPLLSVSCSVLENSPDGKNLSVVCLRYDDPRLAVGRMDDLSVSYVQAYMTGIADDISGLRICKPVHSVPLRAV